LSVILIFSFLLYYLSSFPDIRQSSHRKESEFKRRKSPTKSFNQKEEFKVTRRRKWRCVDSSDISKRRLDSSDISNRRLDRTRQTGSRQVGLVPVLVRARLVSFEPFRVWKWKRRKSKLFGRFVERLLERAGN
jgi:hypothetical protein